MEDVAPDLLWKLQQAFQRNVEMDARGAALLSRIASGGTYADAGEYAEVVGRALTKAFRENLSAADLPDGRMYWNVADRVIRPMLGKDYDMVAEQAAAVQQGLNKAAGIGIKAQTAQLNKDRVDGILNRLDSEPNFDDVAWILQEPVMVFSRSVVDDTVRLNADFQHNAGLAPKIVRTSEYKCCKWCSDLAGLYDYDAMNRNPLFQRHDNCRCLVELVTGKKRDVVHSGKEGMRTYVRDKYDGYEKSAEARRKHAEEMAATKKEREAAARQKKIDTWERKKQLAEAEKSAKMEARKTVGMKSLPQKIAEHPARLASYTPISLKVELENSGCIVTPLKKGHMKDISFEDGGGYKTNFEDGGILMYHPSKYSHHGGEYYKISTGKGGVHHYYVNGEEFEK